MGTHSKQIHLENGKYLNKVHKTGYSLEFAIVRGHVVAAG
jgi:hypothetical protein